MTQPLRVTVVCTDRGGHPSRLLMKLVDYRENPVVDDAGNVWGGFWDGRNPWKPPRVKPSGKPFTMSYMPGETGAGEPGQEFRCPTCRRHLQIRDELLGRAVDGLHAATRANPVLLDISRLPF